MLFPRCNRLQRHLKPSEVQSGSSPKGWSQIQTVYEQIAVPVVTGLFHVVYHFLSTVNFFDKEIISAGEAELVWCLAFEDTVWSRIAATSDLFWQSFYSQVFRTPARKGLLCVAAGSRWCLIFHLAPCGWNLWAQGNLYNQAFQWQLPVVLGKLGLKMQAALSQTTP